MAMAFPWFVRSETLAVPSESENGSVVLVPFLIPRQQFSIVQIGGGLLVTLASLLGVATNLINMRVFLSMSLADGISASFLGLCVSDLLFSVFCTAWGVSTALFGFELTQGITFTLDPFITLRFSANTSQIFYTVTVLNTAYIAVAKCACVVKPLQFKSTFTVQKSFWFTLVCNLILIGLYVPFFVARVPGEKFLADLNRSRISCCKVNKWMPYRANIGILTHSVIPIVAQGIITVCTAGMVWGLRNSSQFRNTSAAATAKTIDSSKGDNAGKGDKVVNRENRVLRQVILLCIIFLLCNIPKVVLRLVALQLTWSETEPKAKYARVFEAVEAFLRQLPACVNSSINIVIYVKYNRKFRQCCRERISCCRFLQATDGNE